MSNPHKLIEIDRLRESAVACCTVILDMGRGPSFAYYRGSPMLSSVALTFYLAALAEIRCDLLEQVTLGVLRTTQIRHQSHLDRDSSLIIPLGRSSLVPRIGTPPLAGHF